MNDIKGEPGELRFTVTIKRAATGAVETYDMIGHADPEKIAALIKHGAAGVLAGSGSTLSNEQPKE